MLGLLDARVFQHEYRVLHVGIKVKRVSYHKVLDTLNRIGMMVDIVGIYTTRKTKEMSWRWSVFICVLEVVKSIEDVNVYMYKKYKWNERGICIYVDRILL